MQDPVEAFSRREFLRLSGTSAAAGLLAFSGLPFLTVQKASRPNILFIIVDDLRPELGCYGTPLIRTPNIDSLAARGMVFTRAYCQQAMCNPSRASVLTGRRPDTIRVWDQSTHFRNFKKDLVTLPQYFKKKGYESIGIGKIFHTSLEDPPSWSQPKPKIEIESEYASPAIRNRILRRAASARMLGKSDGWIQSVLLGPAVEAFDAPDDQYLDGIVTDLALKQLRHLSRRAPFFLAVGYYKPHLPFVAPKKYWDLYDPAEIPKAANDYPPKDAPPFALNDMSELACYQGFSQVSSAAEGGLPEVQARLLKHGYYACASFIDSQIGRLLAELDRLNLRENTILVIWGDHGWKLGEHRAWCKQTNYEIDTRAPLIISAPGCEAAGHSQPALVECVDIYPTLCELAGLAVPQGLEGLSLVPLLSGEVRPWKTAVFSQFQRGFQGKIMGRSIRTERFRYVEWRSWIDGRFIAREIYDHENDPGENINIAGLPENEDLVRSLASILNAGWWKALPR
jgi:iduronate 2-sulfatase